MTHIADKDHLCFGSFTNLTIIALYSAIAGYSLLTRFRKLFR